MTENQTGKHDTASPARNSSIFIRLAEGEYHAQLAAASGVAVVLFSAPHCGSCRTWKRLLPHALGERADALFEVDVSEATGVARYFGIFHLPTIYLYRNGLFHAELQCEAELSRIRQAVEQLLLAPAQDEPD